MFAAPSTFRSGFDTPAVSFDDPTTGGDFGAPTGALGLPSGGFGAPTGGFDDPTTGGFGAPTGGFGAPTGGFDDPTTGGGFGAPTGALGRPSGCFGAPAAHCPVQEPPRGVKLAAFDADTTYACCVAPFVAKKDGGSTSCKRARDESDPPTVTVHIPGRGSVTLPEWFAEEYVMAVPVREGGQLFSGDDAWVYAPVDDVDEERPIFVSTHRNIPGWRVCGSAAAAVTKPPPLLGTPDERDMAAHASAGLALCDAEAVPHAVVPRLVLQHVVGPFIAKLKCTVEQACRGVTTLEAGPDCRLDIVPNVTELSLPRLPVSPLPPKTTILAVGRDSISGTTGVAGAVVLNSPCGLVELELWRVEISPEQMQALPPIPTLKTLTLSHCPSGSAADAHRFLSGLAALTPNVTSLVFDGGHLSNSDVAWHFFDQHSTMWPLATFLKITAAASCVAIMANARPWQRLELDWKLREGAFGPPVVVSDGILEISKSRSKLLLPSGTGASLEEVTVLAEERSMSQCLRFLPDAVSLNLQMLNLPCLELSLAPGSTDGATFCAEAKSLDIRVADVDFGDGHSRPFGAEPGPPGVTAPSPTEAAALDQFFGGSARRSVGSARRERQWSRAAGDAQRWVSSPLAPHTPLDPRNACGVPEGPSQIVLVPAKR